MPTIDRRKLWIASALFLARAVLGLIFFMAGVYKVFQLGPVGHVRRFFLQYQDTFLPTWSLWTVGFVIPFVELGAGFLVLLGWFRTGGYLALLMPPEADRFSLDELRRRTGTSPGSDDG